MRKLNILFVILMLASCSSRKEDVQPVINYSNANSSSLTGKSKIVQKPTLIKLGIEPLKLNQARGYMRNLFDALIPDLERTNITYQMAGNDIILTIQSHIILFLYYQLLVNPSDYLRLYFHVPGNVLVLEASKHHSLLLRLFFLFLPPILPRHCNFLNLSRDYRGCY